MLLNLLKKYLLSSTPLPPHSQVLGCGICKHEYIPEGNVKCFQFALKGPALPAAEWP